MRSYSRNGVSGGIRKVAMKGKCSRASVVVGPPIGCTEGERIDGIGLVGPGNTTLLLNTSCLDIGSPLDINSWV